MLQVKSCKSRTPATPRDRKARGKDWRKKCFLNEQVVKLNFVLEREKKKLSVGKSEWRGERHASAPIFSSAMACAGNNRYNRYNGHSNDSIVTFDFAVYMRSKYVP